MTTDISSHADRRDTPRLAERIDHVLRQLEELYAKLDVLSAGQAPLIEAGDAQRLLGVLSDRQAIITQLQHVHDEFSPFQSRWSECMSELSSSQSEELNKRVDAMASAIEQIAARDEADQSALSARRIEVADRLSEVTKSRSALSAYGAPVTVQTTPRFQNREG